MTITVHLHGNLRRFLPGGVDRTALDVPPGTTVEAVLARVGAARDTWLVAVNGAATERDYVLRAGDLLEGFEPVAGGSTGGARQAEKEATGCQCAT